MNNVISVPRTLQTILIVAGFSAAAFGQISISNSKEIARLNGRSTYIVMNDTASPAAQAYKEIFRKYWTITPVIFIQYHDIMAYLAPDAAFFTIGGYETTSTFTHMTSDGMMHNGLSYTNTHLYLELWLCDPKELAKWQNRKKKSDELPETIKTQLARIEFFTDFPSLSDPDLLYKSDYDGGGHIRNWGPGYLKTDLQMLMQLLSKGKDRNLFETVENKKALKALKKQTLYVPDYLLIKFGKFTGDETKRHEEKDIIGDYKYPYKMVDNEELNRLILDDKIPVYYLVYIKSSTDKFITVYNSQTGEMLYNDYTPVSYNIKGKDLGKLMDAIQSK